MRAPSSLAEDAHYPMSPLDLASGLLTGCDSAVAPAVEQRGVDLATAFRASIAATVGDKQTYVSFSGGRDSSAVLGVAADIARRAGQPDPVPITVRVTGSVSAEESEWQELVVAHLGLRDWVRVDVTDELDVVGTVATRVMQAHGLLYPANAYFHDLIAEHATGGVLLAGGGGDELLEASYAHHHARARLGEERLTARTAAGIALSVGAYPLYLRREARQIPRLRWLRRRAQARFARLLIDSEPAPVHGWAAGVASLVRLRSMDALLQGQDLIAALRATSIANPFLDPRVVGAAMAQGGARGLGGRAAAMGHLAGHVLPDAVAVRTTKASFEDAMWTGVSREALRSGRLLAVIDSDRRLTDLIDIDQLRAEWQSARPHSMTALLAQAAHLALQS